MRYPPVLPEETFQALLAEVKDWQITHGALLKLVRTDDGHTVLSQPVGSTLFPTPFPRELYEEAFSLQKVYNKLYAAVAEDEEWLYEVLKDLIDVDPLANRLWTIYQEVKMEGFLQDATLGIFRSDYMLHDNSGQLELKQVEFNTISCAGGVHSNSISDMHQYLHRTGISQQHFEPELGQTSTIQLNASSLPSNSTRDSIVLGIEKARWHYDSERISPAAVQTCVLFIVQAPNFNIADEKPIEYALWDKGIPCFRVAFGNEVLSQTSLTPNGELLYKPPGTQAKIEVSVVYFRAGFEAREYDDIGHMARFQLEKSRAIKCPSLLSHFTTFKKVQQALTLPHVWSRFLNPEDYELISPSWIPLYPLDESELGRYARGLATDPVTARHYILKPSREGGGHNYYGEDIVKFLQATPQEMWQQYILMERIISPRLSNFLMSSRGIYQGPVISELGIFGVCLWKSAGKERRAWEILNNDEDRHCFSFKTKDASVNEMSVVKGYGCFDSPALIDHDIFSALLKRVSEVEMMVETEREISH